MSAMGFLDCNRQNLNQIGTAFDTSPQDRKLTLKSLQSFNILDQPDPATRLVYESGSVIADFAP
jgi:hypothetical protein